VQDALLSSGQKTKQQQGKMWPQKAPTHPQKSIENVFYLDNQ